ncbi:MAG: hypothetical protein HYR97_04530, partial [Candidatus Melainabacteria bacterium]|nr:hypothetical protein [Candidatus Melainabacteria bacterium]
MRKNKRLNSFLAILCSILILGYSTPGAFAKKTRVTLKLRSTEVNASVIDPSKNVLTIESASNLDTTVSIKPSKRTLKNGKPVNIEGELNDDGNLEVDLSALGPANLIPSGDYIVLARQGKKKLKATFNYNAPTLLVGRLIVPVPA